MAVGIKYFGAGTRGTPLRIQAPSVDEEFDFGDTGLPDLPSSSTTSASSAAAAMNAETARRKFEAEQAAAAAASARVRSGSQAQADYIRNILNQGINIGGLEEQIAQQETAGRQYIEDQARMLADLIGGRRTQAMDLTTRGYDTLRDYLQANPMTAYSAAQRAVPTVQQSALSQYLASRGIGAEPAQAGQDVANAQLAAQAANYNQLLGLLGASETQQQASRMTEQEMARALAGTQLEQLYAGATSGLEQQRLAALNDLANRVSAARLQAEQVRIAREQALQDAIATLLGGGYVAPTATEVPPVVPGGGTSGGSQPIVNPVGAGSGVDTRSRAERVATAGQQYSSFKEAVKALNPVQVAALTADGTGLSAAEIADLKRRNPKLAAQFA